MLKFKLWKLAACLAVLVAGAGRGEAADYRLSDLLAGGSFQSGDKLFSNFHNFSNPGDNCAYGHLFALGDQLSLHHAGHRGGDL